jgi:Leucine-rich repeat (LRR) protein
LSDLCLGLSQLSRLDLSQSGLGSIPGGDLCALTALTHLNLSANRLQDIADLGLQLPASGCSLPLGSLDLSGTYYILTHQSSCRGRVLGRHFFKLLYTAGTIANFFYSVI